MIIRGLALLMLAGSAHAGTVATVTFGSAAQADIKVERGVEARATSGFVLYQHAVWSSAVKPSDAAALQAIGTDAMPRVATSCAALAPAPHHGLTASTAASRLAYWPLVRDAECRNALPPGLLDAVVLQESHYRAAAVSPAGAGGLAQLMPRTAAGLGVLDRFAPAANIDAGARYLRSMLDHYRSVPLALAAYNAGRGAVDRWGGIPLNRETPGYVRGVLGIFNEVDETGSRAPDALPAAVSHAVSLVFGAPSEDTN